MGRAGTPSWAESDLAGTGHCVLPLHFEASVAILEPASYQRAYLSNAYRVLLTRARQGMVIYVPRGDDNDPTRVRSYYDGTYALLASCGLSAISH